MIDNLGERIRQARKKRGFRQADLAEKVGISTGAIGFMEVGKSKPTLENLVKISEICDVDLTWLLKGQESRKIFDEKESKSTDNGAFGAEVENRMLKEQVIKLEAEKEKYLEIIRNLSLGKDEFIGLPAVENKGIQQVSKKVSRPMNKQLTPAA